MKKIIIPIVITAVVVGGLSFYGGIKYGDSIYASRGNRQGFGNLSPEARQQAIAQGGFAGGRRSGAQGGGIAGGEIIGKDDTSITVKLSAGGSKIIFVSSSTPVMKTSAGSFADLVVGDQVMAIGSANSDGSLTAQSIQIRPVPVNK